MDDHHTTPNHHPPKMDVLTETFLQVIHAANWPYPKTAATTFAFSSVCFFFYGLAGAHFARGRRGFALLDHEDPLLKFHMNVVKSARLKPNRYLS